jgi:hypothetical protein
MAQSISCPKCKRVYAVKPELAGKKAKCKCGEKIEFPAMEAPKVEELGELDLLDEKPKAKGKPPAQAGFEPLEQASDYATAPEPKQARPAPAAGGGSTCRNCKATLVPGAVICTNCGFNQRTGQAMRTQVVRGAPPAAPSATRANYSAGSTASAADSDLEGMDWILIILCGGIAFILGIVYLIQGKPKGLKMIIAVIVIQAVCGGIGLVAGLIKGGMS